MLNSSPINTAKKKTAKKKLKLKLILQWEKGLTILLFLLAFSPKSDAQKQANNWYFGNQAGINFNTIPPQPITGGNIQSWEGCASISDELGKLLFYTNGKTIWNAKHKIMQNGTGLLGDTSSTESAIIIPQPSKPHLYYVFTVDEEAGPDGLCYSIVDITLDNGNGAVTSTKNIEILNPVPEKVTAVYHNNGKDIWIISHKWGNSEFYAWLLTETGLSAQPIITDIGTPHIKVEPNPNFIINPLGYMKCSPNGQKIAVALLRSAIVELFDFDDTTGKLSHPVTIPFDPFSTYGVEFSPDGSKLYIAAYKHLYQANLAAGSADDIINSVVQIATLPDFAGAVQLATNGKAYLAYDNSPYLGVINTPDSLGVNCNFEIQGFFLDGGIGRLGLPDFIQSYFLPAQFRAQGSCTGSPISLVISNAAVFDSLQWDFGDPSSGILNFSSQENPTHIFANSGNYNVALTQWVNGQASTVTEIITISRPQLELGNDTIICPNKSILLNAFSDNCSYLWQDFSDKSEFLVTLPGTYSVSIFNSVTQCSNADTINITYTETPPINLGTDTSFCESSNFKLNAFHHKYTYYWNTGATDSSIQIDTAGQYSVQITDSLNCQNADTILLSLYPSPLFSLGADSSICKGTTFRLSPKIEVPHYLWQDNSTENFLNISTAGEYHLSTTNTIGCTSSDTLLITLTEIYQAQLPKDTTICYGSSITFNYLEDDVIFLWQGKSTPENYEINDTGNYTLTASNKCGESQATIFVQQKFCGKIYIPNIITPNSDNINDAFYIKGISATEWAIKIYSRWGDLVFESNNYQNNWKADCCTAGTYYYLLSSTQFEQNYHGWIQVVK